MSSVPRKFASIVAIAALPLATGGCIKKMLTDGQIASTRQASDAFNTFSDWDVAYRAASAGLAQFEGMHNLAPYNQDAMFLLVRGWSGLGFGFIEDEMEQAEDLHGEDSDMAAYHRARGVAAYSRAVFYGTKLLDSIHEGFDGARRNAETMKTWLAGFEEEHAPYLLWTGQAWMSRVNLQKDQPEVVAELFVGYQMVKRSVELDPDYNYAAGHSVLGAYHARSGMAELEESKKHFEEALRLTEGKALLVKFTYATKYHCVKVNEDAYTKLLKEVVEAGDTLPAQRLPNTIAKRRARRYLGKKRMEACGFDMSKG